MIGDNGCNKNSEIEEGIYARFVWRMARGGREIGTKSGFGEVCRREGFWDAAAAEERVLGKKWQLVSSLPRLARALPPYPFGPQALHLAFVQRELPGKPRTKKQTY